MHGSFQRATFFAPIDVEARIERAPPAATVRGMFLHRVREVIVGADPNAEAPRFVDFQSYPVRDLMRLSVRAARLAHRGAPIGEGLRRVGRECSRRFLESLSGKVIFGALGRDISALVRASPAAYRATQSHGRVEVLESGERHAVLAYRGLYQFLECFEVGVIEAQLEVAGLDGEVLVDLDDEANGRLLVRWR